MSGARRRGRRRSSHGDGRGARRRPVHRSRGWRGPLLGGLLALPVGLALAAAMVVSAVPDGGTPTAAGDTGSAQPTLPDDARTPDDFFPSPDPGTDPEPPAPSPARPEAGSGADARTRPSAAPEAGTEDDAAPSPAPSRGGDSGGGAGGGGGDSGGGSAAMSALTEKVVDLTNQERAEAGCSPLRVDDRLTAAAQGHSEDMDANDYMDHTGPDGRGPGDRAADQGYDAWSGENIASGQDDAESVMDAWMNSDGHRRNILNCDSVAIGVGESGRKWTQMFGRE